MDSLSYHLAVYASGTIIEYHDHSHGLKLSLLNMQLLVSLINILYKLVIYVPLSGLSAKEYHYGLLGIRDTLSTRI